MPHDQEEIDAVTRKQDPFVRSVKAEFSSRVQDPSPRPPQEVLREARWYNVLPPEPNVRTGYGVKVIVELTDEAASSVEAGDRDTRERRADRESEEADSVPADLERRGFRIRTMIGPIVTGEIDVDRLDDLAQSPYVARVHASRPLRLSLDESRHEIGADAVHNSPAGFKGAGVIVGIIDTGIDYRHQNFRKADGTSRILAIWDQQPDVVYISADIDAALGLANPLMRVPHEDQDGHGTLVAGVAAGNGRQAGCGKPAGTFVGVAPEADIVVVKSHWKRSAFADAFGDSLAAIEAIKFIVDLAAKRKQPVVINLSAGDNLGSHDGTSPLEHVIDSVSAKPGVAIVVAAGNATGKRQHARRTVREGASETVRFFVPDDTVPDVLEVWYAGGNRLIASIKPPNDAETPTVQPDRSDDTPLASGTVVSIVSDTAANTIGDNRITITLKPASGGRLDRGRWQLKLRGQSVKDGDGQFDVWVQREIGSNEEVSRFRHPFTNDDVTVVVPATAGSAITVASYGFKTGGRAIGEHSSRGPTRLNGPKPDVTAPGVKIVTTCSSSDPICVKAGEPYLSVSGTSFAAPHVTGLIALMLQKRPTLTHTQIRDILTKSATTPTGLTPPDNVWGHGMVDAQAAIQRT
jgi:subtilisin family serine protease